MAQIVVALVCGLPAYVIVKILNPGFFAREDTRTPVWTALASLIFNVAVNLYVVNRYGIVGLAGATAASATLNCVLLYAILHKRGWFHFTARLGGRIARQIVATAASEIETAERRRALLKPPNSLDAWEAHHRSNACRSTAVACAAKPAAVPADVKLAADPAATTEKK